MQQHWSSGNTEQMQKWDGKTPPTPAHASSFSPMREEKGALQSNLRHARQNVSYWCSINSCAFIIDTLKDKSENIHNFDIVMSIQFKIYGTILVTDMKKSQARCARLRSYLNEKQFPAEDSGNKEVIFPHLSSWIL